MSQLGLRPLDVAPRIDRFVAIAGAPVAVAADVIVGVVVDVTVNVSVDVTVDSTVDDAACSGFSVEGVRLLTRATAPKYRTIDKHRQ